MGLHGEFWQNTATEELKIFQSVACCAAASSLPEKSKYVEKHPAGLVCSCPIWFDNKLGIYFVAYNMLSRALHMHWKWATATCSSKGLMPSMTPRFHSFKRESWMSKVVLLQIHWFENNCTVCGRGAPVQGAETLRQKTVCNVYTWFYHKTNKNESFDILKGHPKQRFHHLTSPNHRPSTSSPSEQSALYPTHWRWSQLCLKHVVRYWRL